MRKGPGLELPCVCSGEPPTPAPWGGRGRKARGGGSAEFKLNTHINLLNPDCVNGRRSGRRGLGGGWRQDDDGRGRPSAGPRPLPSLAPPRQCHVGFTTIPNGAGPAGRDG